jgi:uncharacterized surface protein with fasciclin (FAS1) repeats
MKGLIAVLAATLGMGAFASTAAAGDDNIVDTVIALSGASGFDDNGGDFDILRDAVVAADLDEPLSGEADLTVFAPTDQAFLDLTGAGSEDAAFNTVAGLGLDKVRQILKYHVTKGSVGAKKVVKAKKIKTLYKGKNITKKKGSVKLKDKTGRKVTITGPNAAKVSNGIIHVLDGVLLPYPLSK